MKTLLRNPSARTAFLTTLLFFIAFYALIVPLPLYLAELGLPDWQIGLVLGTFGIAALVGRPLAGWSSDRFGRRAVVLSGAVAFLVGVTGMLYTVDPTRLAILRCLQALGYVALTTAATAYITDVTPAEQRGASLAWFGTAANVAMTLTPVLIDALLRSETIGLRGGFWLAAVLSLGCMALGGQMRSVEHASPEEATASEAENGEESDGAARAPAQIWALPRPILLPWLAATIMGMGFGAWFQYLPLLAERRAVEPMGVLYTLYGIAIIITRLVIGPWLDRGRERPILFGGFLLMGTGLALFAFTGSLASYLLATSFVAAGGGILHPLLMALHVRYMPQNMHGRAVATFYLGFDMGNGVGVWLFGFVLDGWGLTALFAGAALSAAIGALVCATVRTRRVETGEVLSPAS